MRDIDLEERSGAVADPPLHGRPLAGPLGLRSPLPPLRVATKNLTLPALIAASIALGFASLLWPSILTTDPWGWTVWGREILHLNLNTVAGPPSWKPLPVLFTTPLALTGSAAPVLWMVIARAGGVLSLIFCVRLARRFAGIGAGIVAACALLLSTVWFRGVAHGYSEALGIALALWAIECHLDGNRRRAVVLGMLVALGRPEAWPLLLLYGIVTSWRADKWTRAAIGLSLLVPPLLWIVPDWLGSGDLFHGGTLARIHSFQSRQMSANTFLQETVHALALPFFALAAVATVFAIRRRVKPVLVFAVVSIGWVLALVLAERMLKYPIDLRFLAVPLALICVLSGIGAAWLVGRWRQQLTCGLVAACLFVFTVAFTVDSVRNLSVAAHGVAVRTPFQNDLRQALVDARAHIQHLPPRIVVPTELWWNAGAIAWTLNTPIERVTKVGEGYLGRARGVKLPALLVTPLGSSVPDDPAWVGTASVRNRHVAIRELAHSGIWHVFALTRRHR